MDHEETIFEFALAINPPAREAYLEGACAGDALMLGRLQGLLRAHDRAGGFLERVPVAARALAPDAGVPVALTGATGAWGLTERAGDRIGRYKLLQQIGEGGCGVVYMAEQEQPVHRRVALKIIKLGMDTRRVVARFEAERQALALMDHPNIAKVFDGGATATGRPYFVMELVRGIKITDYCDERKLTTQQRLELFIQVCRAVQHAHQKGIIHRDLKPSNILVTVNDGVAVPKIIDFGIAKATNHQRLTDKTLFTAFEQFIGTPAYMSPEQTEITSVDIDTRSDIYSLGVLLYELLTGRTPFDAIALLKAGLDQMRRTIREQEPAWPSTRLKTLGGEELTAAAGRRGSEPPRLISQLRGDLDWIVMKCLAKDRGRRYDTAIGLANDIRRYLNTEPVSARPPSRLYEFQKSVRRHWVGYSATATVLVVLLLGVVASTWQAARARRAERDQFNLRELALRARAKEAEQRQRAELSEREAHRLLYATGMHLAQHAWRQNDVGQVRQLLQDTAAYSGRGFEWYYWQRQTHLALQTLRGHLGPVWAVALSPDGQQTITGSKDGTAIVWDTATGKELFSLRGHRAPITAVVYSADGKRIVTASRDKTAKVWEAASGRELFTLNGHTRWVNFAAYSPDHQYIVTGSEDGEARMWDAASGRELLTFKGHNKPVNWVAFSADGRRIVTGSDDETARVWDTASGEPLYVLKGHTSFIYWVAYTADSRRILTASKDGTARVWDAADGKELFTLRGHQRAIMTGAVWPDSRRFITASEDGTARIWDAANGKELFILKGHSAAIETVAISRDGSRIATGSRDRTARIWDAQSGELLFKFQGHSAAVMSVAFSSDGQRIVTGSADQTAKVWDTASADEPSTLAEDGREIWAVACSPDGRWIATGSGDGAATVWEAASGRKLLIRKGHSGPVKSLAFSPDSQRIVTVSGDETGQVWDVASGQELCSLRGPGGAIQSVAFSPDGRRIVTGGDDWIARIWEAASGKLLQELKGHHDAVFAVAFSPDGERVVTGSRDHTARVWETASGKPPLTLRAHDGGICSAAFSPDGRRIVTGSWDKKAKIWDARDGRELRTLKGHSDAVSAVAFSPDGQRIFTGSRDQTARLWETATGQEVLILHAHAGGVSSAAFAPDGQRIITAGGEETAKVWMAATAEQLALWDREDREAAAHLAALARELEAAAAHERVLRGMDPGAIKQWLVLAPIAYQGRSGAVALAQEQVPREALRQARAGERVPVGKAELVWQAVSLEDYQLDLNQLVNANTRSCVAYAVCFIQSETDQHDLSTKVGSDDQSVVFLNGKEIYRCEWDRTYLADEDVVTGVELKVGLNVLVFKVANEGGDWMGSIRFTDSAGQPVRGIQVALAPPPAAQPLAKGPSP